VQGSVWELYCSLCICLNLFWLRGSACFAYDKTVINQRRIEKSAFEDLSEENPVSITKWTTLLRIFYKILFTPAVTSCSCKIFQINQVYEYELGKFMYKIVHNCFPSFICNYYSHINETHNYPTRISTNNNLATTSSKKSLTRRSIQYTGPTLWNNIPKDVRNKSFLAFCPTYKKYLLDQVVL